MCVCVYVSLLAIMYEYYQPPKKNNTLGVT